MKGCVAHGRVAFPAVRQLVVRSGSGRVGHAKDAVARRLDVPDAWVDLDPVLRERGAGLQRERRGELAPGAADRLFVVRFSGLHEDVGQGEARDVQALQALAADAGGEHLVQVVVHVRRDEETLTGPPCRGLGEGFEAAVSGRPFAGVDGFEALFRLGEKDVIRRVIRHAASMVRRSTLAQFRTFEKEKRARTVRPGRRASNGTGAERVRIRGDCGVWHSTTCGRIPRSLRRSS